MGFEYANYEDRVETIMDNTIDELKTFGFSEDKAKNLLEDLYSYSEADKNYNIQNT